MSWVREMVVSPPCNLTVPLLEKASFTVRLFPARSRVPEVMVRSWPVAFTVIAVARVTVPEDLFIVNVPVGTVPPLSV